MIKNYLKLFLPIFIKRYIEFHLEYDRQLIEHDRLNNITNELKPAHINNLIVLTNRIELLKHIPKNGNFAEIGVAEGDFSKQILNICRPTKLHLIDHWKSSNTKYGEFAYENVKCRFEKEICDGRIVLHRMDSSKMDETFQNSSLDFVYIDANHSYDSVKQDLMISRKKLKLNGILSGHDYIRWNGNMRYGVVEAVNEFCVRFQYQLVYLTNESHRNLSYALKKM